MTLENPAAVRERKLAEHREYEQTNSKNTQKKNTDTMFAAVFAPCFI